MRAMQRSEKCARGTRAAGHAVAAGLLLAGFGGCGGSAQGPTVVRVGNAAIGSSTVAHWTRVISRGGLLGGLGGEPHGTPKQQALAFLISSDWLDGEAAKEGLAVSADAVDRVLTEHMKADGTAEFTENLHVAGKTIADVKLEIKAELAAAAIHRRLAAHTVQVSQREVVGYYESNRRQFRTPEERNVDLIEDLPSRSAAAALAERVGSGARFAKMALHERLNQAGERAAGVPEKDRVMRAIFSARPGKASRPMELNQAWIVFVVRSITPASYKSLANVQAAIAKQLDAQQRQRLVAEFEKGYRARWTARTSCRPGYVVQGCAQYAGPLRAGERALP
jgi:foldase protein PrsA